MKLDDLGTKSYGSLTENAELIKNRQAIAMGWFTTVPASFMLDLGTSRKLRMLSVPDDIIEKIRQVNPGFQRHVIPKATYAQYGVEEDVVTFQAATILIVHARTPADVVYKITKAVVEGREDFARVTAAMKGVTAKDMAQSFGMPYHPGRGEVLPGSGPAEVAAPGAQAHRLPGPGRGRGGGRHGPLPRLRPADAGGPRQPRPPRHHAGLLPGPGISAVSVQRTPLDEESTRLDAAADAPTDDPVE